MSGNFFINFLYINVGEHLCSCIYQSLGSPGAAAEEKPMYICITYQRRMVQGDQIGRMLCLLGDG
jgi:hypothetical protein